MKGFFAVATSAVAVLANVSSTSASSDFEKRITHTGQCTWYNPPTGNDGCGYKVPSGAPAVHVSSKYWRNGENCGQWVNIKANGKQSYGIVTGECKTCPPEGIDTAPILFNDFGPQDDGLYQSQWNFMNKNWTPSLPECEE